MRVGIRPVVYRPVVCTAALIEGIRISSPIGDAPGASGGAGCECPYSNTRSTVEWTDGVVIVAVRLNVGEGIVRTSTSDAVYRHEILVRCASTSQSCLAVIPLVNGVAC